MFFVAEIGSNWEGDMDKAQRLIKECKEAGADAVKFQIWRADDLYNGKYKKYEVGVSEAWAFFNFAKLEGIECFFSVFYPEAVDICEELGVKRYKLASRTMLGDDPFRNDTILAVRKTGKPIIQSNGKDINSKNVKKLYCIPKYPANPLEIDWDKAQKCDGFSDHTLGIESALKYAKLKPDSIIEKHVKLEDSKGPDAFFSITTQELAQLITLSTSPSVKLE